MMFFSKKQMHVDWNACLNDEEAYLFAKELGLITPKWIGIMRIVLLLFLISIAVFTFFQIDKIFGLVLLFLCFVCGILLFKPKYNKKAIANYYDSLRNFYQTKLSEYTNFEIVYLENYVLQNSYLTNNRVLLLSDGYEFYIYDDFLRETIYAIPQSVQEIKNIKPVLKVLDANYVNKQPISFNITDISFFTLINSNVQNKNVKENKLYSNNSTRVLDDYVWLELNNHTIFKLSVEAIKFLRNKAPEKEKLSGNKW